MSGHRLNPAVSPRCPYHLTALFDLDRDEGTKRPKPSSVPRAAARAHTLRHGRTWAALEYALLWPAS